MMGNESDTLTYPDMMDLLKSRASAIKLADPGPTSAQIDAILQAAVTAADHGRIRPWRFTVMTGEGRGRLGELMVQSKKAMDPATDPEELEKARSKAFRAPVVIALSCEPDVDNYKVPVIEQMLATAAAGAQLMLAVNALGFGCNWKTGALAYDPLVKKGLGLSDNGAIVGFFYIGDEPKRSPLARAGINEVVNYWLDRA